jgi:hypothetical protein
MPYEDDIDVEIADDLTEEDRLAGLPSGFGQYHSRFHPTPSKAFQSAAEKTDIDISPQTNDPELLSKIDGYVQSLLPTKR